MTLIVALRYQNGVVLACDSRATFDGPVALMRNEERKFEFLGNDIAMAYAWMSGFENKVSEELRSWFQSSRSPTLNDVVEKCEDILWAIYQKYKERFEKEELEFPTIVLATHDKMFRIFENGYAEAESKYACEGSGLPYGEFILSQNFKPSMSEEEAKHLATYTILQTSRIDPNVGGRVNMVVVQKGKIQSVTEQEINQILEDTQTIETQQERAIQNIVREIIETRRWINAKFKEKFGFELFEQNEFAISGIQKPCQNENDFTHGILALALLVDGINASALDKMIKDHPPGSLNALETFLNEKCPGYDKEIITKLREIMILRSKKMPIHEDDPKIIQVLIKWEYKIPPNWSSLWIKALQKYEESITGLGQLF